MPDARTFAAIAVSLAPTTSSAQSPSEERGPRFELYGAVIFDLGYDFGQLGNPLWQDVLRPTELPAFEGEFGLGTRTFAGVRQSYSGMTATMPTEYGDVQTRLEFDLLGVGEEAGQTTFHLTQCYGRWNGVLAGQTWTPFMDPDVLPDAIEYWGPNGAVYFRNVQLAYRHIHGGLELAIALEQPGATADADTYAERIDIDDVIPGFPIPDVSGHAKYSGAWGHVQLAGIVRYIKWDVVEPTPVVAGHVYGWGANASAVIELGAATLKLQAVYGRAIENYMNDAAADIGPVRVTGPAGTPALDGVALPVVGLLGFVDVEWTELLTSTAGYSLMSIDNSSGQAPDAFQIGHYALANLLFQPTENVLLGPEAQFARRTNFRDDFSANDYRLQLSIQYSFSAHLGR